MTKSNLFIILKKLFMFFISIFFSLNISAQTAPPIEWQKSFGGSNNDVPNRGIQTKDGGYAIAGYSISNNGDVSGNNGNKDFWIVKMDANRAIQWQKSLGGTGDEFATRFQQTFDGGYILVGQSNSNNGNVTGNHGGDDYWVVKLDSVGNLKWQKSLGGTNNDIANFVIQTKDSGYVIVGNSQSNNGDVTGNHGDYDYWVVKIDTIGNIKWQKSLGGSGLDVATCVQQTIDSNYIVGGYSSSNNGNVTGNHGLNDYWIVKLDAIGNVLFQKSYGGTGDDYPYAIQQTLDSGYVIAGSSRSNNGDVTSNQGLSDIWVVKINSIGTLTWQKSFGGTNTENANAIKQTSDSGYIVGSQTLSNNGDVSGNHGIQDFWITKLTNSGTVQWKKSLGGTGDDYLADLVITSDGGYLATGPSTSNNGDVNGNHGGYDFWIVKLTASTTTTSSSIITTIAGGGSGGDGGLATSASLDLPYAVAVGANGNVFIADRNNQRIRKIDNSGIISTIAGNGNGSFSGDGGLATSASIANPYGLAIDASGNMFIADFSNNRIRKIATNGIITTVAGNGSATFSGDGGLATSASLNGPTGVSVDLNGNIYIADYYNNRIRKVTASTGIITTVAGTGTIGFSGDGNLATVATFYNPYDVQVDKSGNLYIADFLNHRIRKVSTNGIITTIAGSGATGAGNGSFSGDGSLATSATLHGPTRLALDTSLNIFIADYANHRIRKISSNGIISTITGTGTATFSGDGGLASLAAINTPTGVALDASGNLYIADLNNNRVRKVTNQVVPVAPFEIINTIAGTGSANFSGDGGNATSATLNLPYAVTLDATGNLFVADRNNHRIRKIGVNGIITTIVGNGTPGFGGDGGNATSASLLYPYAITLDASGNLYIADFGNHRIRKVSTTGIITTVAGNGSGAFSGDGGNATSASLNNPTGVSVDKNGVIYISDYTNNRIRKVALNGIITTVAGTGVQGFSGDGNLATSAALNNPYDVTVDTAGNLYIADFLNHRIRKVATNGIITTIAGSGAIGNGNGGFSGDGSLATSATLNGPIRLALDSFSNIFIAGFNHRIRKISSNGIISTVAGNGTAGFSGDGGVAIAAQINTPSGLAVDKAGNLYIADLNNHRIRKVGSNTVLPVTLLTFNGNKQNDAIHLQWTTTNEINTASFSIQRATNGTNFTDIGSVAANGNTTSTTTYTFRDNQPNNGKNYYRLKMIDKDGSFTYSSVIVFTLEELPILIFKLSPNPAKNYAQLQVSSNKEEIVNIFIVDANGKILLTQKNYLFTGSNVISLNNINILREGLYFVRTVVNGQTKTQKLLIAK